MSDEAATALAKWLDLPARSSLQLDLAEQDIVALECLYGLRIPDDMRAFLRLTAGVEGHVWDGEDVLWWAVDRIKNIPDEYQQEIANPEIADEASAYLFFADYFFWCWAFAICCSDGPNRGRVAIISAGDDFVADSFSDFVTQYLRDPISMMR